MSPVGARAVPSQILQAGEFVRFIQVLSLLCHVTLELDVRVYSNKKVAQSAYCQTMPEISKRNTLNALSCPHTKRTQDGGAKPYNLIRATRTC